MTRLQMQKEIVKQFKRRFSNEYGRNWRTLWTLSTKFYDGNMKTELMSLTLSQDFSRITVNIDCCLNLSLSIIGCSVNFVTVECVCNVFKDIINCIHWQLSKDRIYDALW